jgi:hypothetical protein
MKNPTNKYGVQKRQWRKWCPLARHFFNFTHKLMKNRGLYPESFFELSPSCRKVVAWNAAWMVADEIQEFYKPLLVKNSKTDEDQS